MATSSIKRSFVIDNDEDLEIFLNAIEASKNDPAPESNIKVRYLHGPEDMAEFWKKRRELDAKREGKIYGN